MPVALGPLILLDDLSWQTSVRGHVKTLLLSPDPDLTAALPAGRGADLGPAAPAVHPPGVLDKGFKPTPQVGRVLGTQIKLVRRAFQRELNRLVGRAAGQIVLQLYLKPLHRFPPERMAGAKAPAPDEPHSYPDRRHSMASMKSLASLRRRPRGLVFPADRANTVLSQYFRFDEPDCGARTGLAVA